MKDSKENRYPCTFINRYPTTFLNNSQKGFFTPAFILIIFKNNNTNAKFAQHLSEKGHTFRKIDDIMDIKQVARKNVHMNTMEKFLYIKTKKNNQMNDKNTVPYNKIFKETLDRDSHLTSQQTQLPFTVNE
jgi:hypothetical protein